MSRLFQLDQLALRASGLSARSRLGLLALLALLMFLPGFASLPVTDRDEARFLQASRQMVQSGDPIDIRFQEVPRYKKPVGIYWAQAGAALLSGQGDAAPVWVWRLPSLIGAMAAVVLVAVVGAPLVGAGAATFAALLFAASLVLAGEARIAKTDAALLATILTMQAALARLYLAQIPPMKPRLAYVFWLGFGLSVLIKGPIGPMIAGLTLLCASLLRRDAHWLRPLAKLWPMLLGFALFLPWLIAITLKSEGGFWHASVGEDLLTKAAAGQEGKGLPPGTYLILLWVSFWPGSVVLAMALPQIWRQKAQPGMVFLISWLLPSWLVFEAVPTKLFHYTMPLYPALALMAVAAFLAAKPRLTTAALLAGLLALLPGFIVAGYGFSLISEWQGPDKATLVLALATAVAGLMVAPFWAAARRDLRPAMLVILVIIGSVLNAGLLAGLSRLPALWPSVQIYQAALLATKTRNCARPLVVGWGYTEPSLVWLAGRQTVLLGTDQTPEQSLIADPCTVIAMVKNTTIAAPDGLMPIGKITGFAIGAGRAVNLEILQPKAAP